MRVSGSLLLAAALRTELRTLSLGTAVGTHELFPLFHVHMLAFVDVLERCFLACRLSLAGRKGRFDLDLGRWSALQAQPRVGVPALVAEVVGALGAAMEVLLGLKDGGLALSRLLAG